MLNFFGVVVFHKSMVNWRGWKLMHCSGVPEIYHQLEEGGISALGICALFDM